MNKPRNKLAAAILTMGAVEENTYGKDNKV